MFGVFLLTCFNYLDVSGIRGDENGRNKANKFKRIRWWKNERDGKGEGRERHKSGEKQ